MSISIASSPSVPVFAAADSSSTSAPRNTKSSASTAADTVQLSEAQQIYQLYNEGQKVSQIATSLSLPVEIVNTYLGISGTAS